jgi:bidirectional [NiFe] hydrogenase diaphorase subunit
VTTEELLALTSETGAIKPCLAVCSGAACQSGGSDAVRAALDAVVGKDGPIAVQGTGCLGLCSRGPLVSRQPDGTVFADVQPDNAAAILRAGGPGDDGPAVFSPDLPFFARQTRIVLAGAGLVDPEHIETALADGAYHALGKALTEMTPQQVIDEVARSGLRGRGGAGFSTGVKWGLVARTQSDQKYVVCNGDEGDPGAFMDRSVMEGDPHRVLEGMALAGYAVGANQGYIYVRGEYPLAIKRLQTAIRQAERQGLLGARVLDTHFQFRVDLRIGAGAFVCGEETALLASIEGGRGSPRPRPPYPGQSGLFGKPTLINNVESFANIAPIILRGGDWYASIGTEKSKGTKVFALAGKIVNTGLIEVPLGTPLRDIIFDVGGGIPGDREFKGVLTGGPSGGCIPASMLDLPVDYESLAKVGSIVGSGGLIVMDDTSCMVDVARFYMEFSMHESCGKCIPCRDGTRQAVQILERITTGRGITRDLDVLEDLSDLMQQTSLCGLGQNAPNPLVSTLNHFRNEYLAHITDRVCPAGVCQMQPKGAEVPA